MKFYVMSRSLAEAYVQQEHKDTYAVISISCAKDPDPADLKSLATSHSGMIACLPLAFDDVLTCEKWGQAMTAEQGKEIVAFVSTYLTKVDYFIVHCEAGQSRSAGVAAALSKWIDGDDWDYFLSPKYTPNSHCYRMVLEAACGSAFDEDELSQEMKANRDLEIYWDV